MSQPHALYLCYFGIREPLVQTQVLPYLRELVKGGYRISLLTFEPSEASREFRTSGSAELRTQLAETGVEWHWLPYHKRLSVIATAWDIFRGTVFVRQFISRERPELLHGRVHVPTLMGALGRKLSRHKPKLLFDIRGFFPEEYTDAGVWPEGGWLYRAAKRVEKWLLKESDGFVVLTEKARSILFPESKETGVDKFGRPVEVIPCCVDLEKFDKANAESRRNMREQLGIGDRKVIAYVGSFGGWYMTDEMIDFFAAVREADSNTFVLILTQRDKYKVRDALLHRGFGEGDFFVDGVRPDQIPTYLSAADVAISFIKPCYSKLSSSPTKIAEYLACGVPVISNRGIGDVDELIETKRAGALLDDFRKESYLAAAKAVDRLDDVSQRCRETARIEFDLTSVAGKRYRRLYDRFGKDNEVRFSRDRVPGVR